MQPLLMWSLRLVEDLSDDIIAAFTEYQRLARRGTSSRHRLAAEERDRRGNGDLQPVVTAWLDDLRRRGGHLPGRANAPHEINWTHLARCSTARRLP